MSETVPLGKPSPRVSVGCSVVIVVVLPLASVVTTVKGGGGAAVVEGGGTGVKVVDGVGRTNGVVLMERLVVNARDPLFEEPRWVVVTRDPLLEEPGWSIDVRDPLLEEPDRSVVDELGLAVLFVVTEIIATPKSDLSQS